MKKKSNKKTNGFAKFIYILTVLLVLSFPFINVFSKSMLSKINYEVEEIKEEKVLQAKTNENLEMQINELASLENLEAVAKSMGLSYNYSSVKTVK